MSIKSLFEDIADAIKTKGGTSTALTPAEMPRAILNLPTGSSAASGVSYDNTASGLTANNVQDAIDELAEDVSTINSDLSELITTEVFDCPEFTIAAGTPGTYVGVYNVDVSKSGYVPVSATLYNIKHPIGYIIYTALYNNAIYFFVYRTMNRSNSYPAGDISAVVTYSKIVN